MKILKHLIFTAAALMVPMAVQAHPGYDQPGWGYGATHPFTGLDHLLAMLAVGLWASQLGGRARWLVPVAFVVVMAIGGAMGVAGVPMPGVEQGIAASVLVLGLLVAMAVRLPVFAGAQLVGVFAVFHGHAHGAEMPVDASGALYGLGFIMSTAILHAIGVGGGLLAFSIKHPILPRLAGAAVAVCGLAMLTGLL